MYPHAPGRSQKRKAHGDFRNLMAAPEDQVGIAQALRAVPSERCGSGMLVWWALHSPSPDAKRFHEVKSDEGHGISGMKHQIRRSQALSVRMNRHTHARN